KRRPARQENGQRAHLRTRGRARRRAAPPARRDPQLFRRPGAADDGAARRGREIDARRHPRVGEDDRQTRSRAEIPQDGEDAMTALLTNHLWQSTVFCLAVALTAVLLRPNRAHVRYALWFAASLKFLVPFSLLVSLGALVPIRVAQPASTPVAPGAFSITVDQLTQPF